MAEHRRVLTDEEFEVHRQRPDRRIASVFIFPNGMVAVCDQFGQQMGEYQGRWSEMQSTIEAVAGAEVEWHGKRG